MFSGIITVLLCCFGQLSIKKAQVGNLSNLTNHEYHQRQQQRHYQEFHQHEHHILQGLLLMSLVVTVVNLINLVVLEVRLASISKTCHSQNHHNQNFNQIHDDDNDVVGDIVIFISIKMIRIAIKMILILSGWRVARFSLPD